MVLVHHDAVVVLATGVTATARMLAVLAHTTMACGNQTKACVSAYQRKLLSRLVSKGSQTAHRRRQGTCLPV